MQASFRFMCSSAFLLGLVACGNSQPGSDSALGSAASQDRAPLTTGMAPYYFETDNGGWSVENNAGTAQQVGPSSGPLLGPAYQGSGSLYWQIGYNGNNNLQLVNRNSSANLTPGSTLSMYIYLGDHSGFSKITPFTQTGSNYAFSGIDLTSSNGLPDHGWVQALLPVPPSNGAVVGIGIYINCAGVCTGDLYVDSVTQI